MEQAYRTYCKVTLVVFLLNTVYPITMKVLQNRLAGDWVHSTLHFASALCAFYAIRALPEIMPAKLFTWGIGLIYFALGLAGWFIPGIFLNTPFAIPLGPADNIFHLLLSVPALLIAARDLLSRPAGASPA